MSVQDNIRPRLAAESTNPVLGRMVDLEMARIVECWRFEGDAVHVLLALPEGGCACGTKHCWFVNRDGRTRCWECDALYVKERETFARPEPIRRSAHPERAVAQ